MHGKPNCFTLLAANALRFLILLLICENKIANNFSGKYRWNDLFQMRSFSFFRLIDPENQAMQASKHQFFPVLKIPQIINLKTRRCRPFSHLKKTCKSLTQLNLTNSRTLVLCLPFKQKKSLPSYQQSTLSCSKY